MPKKFIIKDEEGKTLEVTEEEMSVDSEDKPEEATNVTDELSSEDIASLKLLAQHAKDLIALLHVEENEHKNEVIEETDACDEDENEEDEDEEEKSITSDSKSSVGSIEVKMTNDSIDCQENAVSDAWSLRYSKQKGE